MTDKPVSKRDEILNSLPILKQFTKEESANITIEFNKKMDRLRRNGYKHTK